MKLLILAWGRRRVINGGKGGGKSCSWLPQQFGHRNGISDTGKQLIISNFYFS